MGVLMNDNEYRHSGGTHGDIWRLCDSIQGCEGLNSYSLKLLPGDEGEFQSLQEQGHPESCCCRGGKDPHLQLFNFFGHNTLSSALLGRNESLPQLSSLLFVSKMSTPGTPHAGSHNEELLLCLKGDQVWKQQTHVKAVADKWLVSDSLEANTWPFPKEPAQMDPPMDGVSGQSFIKAVDVSRGLCLGCSNWSIGSRCWRASIN